MWPSSVGVRLEKFSACGDTVKNVGDADRRSRWHPAGFTLTSLPPRIRCACLRLPLRRALRQQSRYGGDRWAAPPREPQRAIESKSSASATCSSRGVRPSSASSWSCRDRRRSRDHAFAADSTSTRIRFAPASMAFSSSSLTTVPAARHFSRGNLIRNRLRQYAYSAHFSLIAIPVDRAVLCRRRRRFGHQILAAVVSRNDDFADDFSPAEHDTRFDAEPDPAVRRSAVSQRVEEKSRSGGAIALRTGLAFE